MIVARRALMSVVVAVSLSLVHGCQPTVKVVPEEAAFLDAAKAVYQRNAAGEVVVVDLRKSEISDELLRSTAALKNVKTLSLADTSVTDQQVALLADLADTLVSIDLRNCPVTNDAMTTLGNFKALQAVWLSGKGNTTLVDDGGLEALGGLPELKILTLDDLWITTDGVKQLTKCSKLEELYLANTSFDDDGMALLSSFPNLTRLRIARTSISDAGLVHLQSARKLVELDLSELSTITDAGLEPLGKVTSLKKLNLWRVSATDDGIRHLKNLTALEWLNLDNTKLTNAGLDTFQNLTNLTYLHLGSTQITDSGVSDLFHLTKLKDLKVTRTAVTEVGATALKKELPNTAVQLLYLEK